MTNKEQIDALSKQIDLALSAYKEQNITAQTLMLVEKTVRNILGDEAVDWHIDVKPDSTYKDRVIVTVYEPKPTEHIEVTFNV